MDIWDKQKRSDVMSKIHSKNTKPELMLRKALFARGFRYRINCKNFPGKPDLVLSKYKTVIFVNGCFWHQHEGCKYAYVPKSNKDFWAMKLALNKARDIKVIDTLILLNWNVIVVWECEISKKTITNILNKISLFLTDAHLKPCMFVN